jgi:lipopolysaccharide/colanic/teichoic acid biosynthesis glycosyltransferase
MAKRLLDVTLAGVALLVLAPLLLVAAIGVRLSGPGPVIYRARRVGRDGEEFTMYKFRTMRVEPQPAASVVTAFRDPRVFPFGALLRATKIDELPQLVNVLRGDMSIIGPRPEDPKIVQHVYSTWQVRTLDVRPGLTGPGSLFSFTHLDRLIGSEDPERDYRERVLGLKLAMELVYMRSASVSYDLTVIARTLWTLACYALGRREFPEPVELSPARRLLELLARGDARRAGAAR